jgi:hypothetical protein
MPTVSPLSPPLPLFNRWNIFPLVKLPERPPINIHALYISRLLRAPAIFLGLLPDFVLLRMLLCAITWRWYPMLFLYLFIMCFHYFVW